MPKINLDKAELGMVVAEDVIGSQGRMLLGKGTVISDKHIRIMKTWGINALVIEGEEEFAESIPLSPELLQQAENEIKPIFSKTNLDHPVVAHLHQERIKSMAARKMGSH